MDLSARTLSRDRAGHETAAGTGRIARHGLADGRSSEFVRFAVAAIRKIIFWSNGSAIAPTATCWTPCRRWTVSSRSRRAKATTCCRCSTPRPTPIFPRLEDFMGVSQITAPDQIFHWQSRSNFLPLVTAGQKPVFLDDADTLRALTQPDFDGSKIVFLPPEAKSLVTVTNQTARPGARFTASEPKAWTPKSKPPNRRSSSLRRPIITTGAPRWMASRRRCCARITRFKPSQVPAGTASRPAGLRRPRV